MKRILSLTLVLGLGVTGSLAAQELIDQSVAVMKAQGSVIEWSPTVEFQRIDLRVSCGELRWEATFDRGRNPFFELSENGRPLPDGLYNYELTVVPQFEADLRERLMKLREEGNSRELARMRKSGELPSKQVQSGTFAVREGRVMDASLDEGGDGDPRPRPENPEVKAGGDLVVWGDLKVRGTRSLAMLDPEDKGVSIHFAALEGPEVGTYYRGSAKISEGRAVIDLPDHFAKVTSRRGVTVQLTPIGGWSPLFVVEKSPRRIVVGQPRGAEPVEFDFLVQGIRAGQEEFQVERKSGADLLLFPELSGD